MMRDDPPYTGPERRLRARRVADRRGQPGPSRAEPASEPAPERRAGMRRGSRTAIALAAVVLGTVAFIRWSRSAYEPESPATPDPPSATVRAEPGAARARAEALCRLLARSPRFAPPMAVEPEVTIASGRSTPSSPALAAQQALGLDGPWVLRRWLQRVGDFDVAEIWLRQPADGRHDLVVAWIEGDELALCRFHFACVGPELTAEEARWGDELLDRLLAPRNFRARSLPPGGRRSQPGSGLPTFGPGSRARG